MTAGGNGTCRAAAAAALFSVLRRLPMRKGRSAVSSMPQSSRSVSSRQLRRAPAALLSHARAERPVDGRLVYRISGAPKTLRRNAPGVGSTSAPACSLTITGRRTEHALLGFRLARTRQAWAGVLHLSRRAPSRSSQPLAAGDLVKVQVDIRPAPLPQLRGAETACGSTSHG